MKSLKVSLVPAVLLVPLPLPQLTVRCPAMPDRLGQPGSSCRNSRQQPKSATALALSSINAKCKSSLLRGACSAHHCRDLADGFVQRRQGPHQPMTAKAPHNQRPRRRESFPWTIVLVTKSSLLGRVKIFFHTLEGGIRNLGVHRVSKRRPQNFWT